MKQKYVFEKYEYGVRGRIFMGYVTVLAESVENARETAQTKVGESITLAQIYVPQN